MQQMAEWLRCSRQSVTFDVAENIVKYFTYTSHYIQVWYNNEGADYQHGFAISTRSTSSKVQNTSFLSHV